MLNGIELYFHFPLLVVLWSDMLGSIHSREESLRRS